MSGVLVTVIWWYFQKNSINANIHAGFRSFAVWRYSTAGSIEGRDSHSG